MLDRTEYEKYWYAFQEKLDEILAERKMSYRKSSVEIRKFPGYIHDVIIGRINPFLNNYLKLKNILVVLYGIF